MKKCILNNRTSNIKLIQKNLIRDKVVHNLQMKNNYKFSWTQINICTRSTRIRFWLEVDDVLSRDGPWLVYDQNRIFHPWSHTNVGLLPHHFRPLSWTICDLSMLALEPEIETIFSISIVNSKDKTNSME